MNGEQLLIAVPANSDHDLFEEKNFAPRLLQDVPNEDFIIEVKFDSLVSSRYQTQGIVIEQDTDNFLRLEYYHNGTSTFMYAAFFQDGQATVKANQAIVVPAESGSLYMRVTRAGNSWQQERSFDGLTWVTNATFDHTLTVANAGVYGGNVDPVPGGEDTSPAYTAVVDYFFNTASQIDPEDGQPLVPSTATVGSGSIAINPDKETYTCTEPIQLTATPAEGWSFSSWSGAVTGTTNPTTMTLAQGDSVTATFVQSQTLIYLPIVVR
jgi:regulation of enolase protein 1 (concanavalin A-like superfamily)